MLCEAPAKSRRTSEAQGPRSTISATLAAIRERRLGGNMGSRRSQAWTSADRSKAAMADCEQTVIPERPKYRSALKTSARRLLHRHKAGTDRHTGTEICTGSGQLHVAEATIIAAPNRRLREALREMTR